MTSADLADEVERTIRACRERILGVGESQYSIGDRQQFEDMSPADLLAYAQEEVEDLINYGVMTRIRLQHVLDLLGEEY